MASTAFGDPGSAQASLRKDPGMSTVTVTDTTAPYVVVDEAVDDEVVDEVVDEAVDGAEVAEEEAERTKSAADAKKAADARAAAEGAKRAADEAKAAVAALAKKQREEAAARERQLAKQREILEAENKKRLEDEKREILEAEKKKRLEDERKRLEAEKIPVTSWVWPKDNNGNAALVTGWADYHPRIGGGKEVVNGWERGNYKLEHAVDSKADHGGRPFHTFDNHGVNGNNGNDYIDFIFTFADANTWCSGYRQFGDRQWGDSTFTKDIEIYTANSTNGPWTKVATGSHSKWHNNTNPTFTNAGTTTEWTPRAPSKYLKVRTLTNQGDTGNGGRVTVKYLQLKVGK